MRAAVKQAITDIIPPLTDRLYDVQPPAEEAGEPYGIIVLGEEIWKSSWAGYRQVVRLKLSAGAAGLKQADAWADALIAGLHHKRVASTDGPPFTLYYLGAREAERLEPATGAAYRVLRFSVYRPERQAEPDIRTDGWLEALADWTSRKLGGEWSVYHTAWPSGRADCSVLWRLAGCETRMAGASLYEVRKRFTGHVVGADASSELLAAVSLIEGLGAEVQLLIDAEQRKYMSVAEITADLQADAFLEGQLHLTVVQRRMRPAEEAALIRRVDIHPILK